MKNKGLIILLAVLLACGAFGCSTYNSLVGEDETVKQAWSQVENQYQRRLDLIPNLVNTVKGYASHEKETLNSVIEARSKATSTTIDAGNLTEESMAKLQASQDQLSSALSRLMVVVERYPELKANENFKELQTQLEGTENRITVARKDYTEKVQVFNTQVRKFPTVLFAGILGFKAYPAFKATEGADRAPQVDFGE